MNKRAKEYANNLKQTIQNIEDEYNMQINNLSKIDKAINDIEHIIECKNFNILKGYMLANIIKSLRLERREIKNEIETLLILKGYNNITLNTISNAINKIKEKEVKQKTRQYRPKILTENDINNFTLNKVLGSKEDNTKLNRLKSVYY